VLQQGSDDAAEAQYRLAATYRAAGLVSEAVGACQAPTRSTCYGIPAAVALGALLIACGDTDEAGRWLERASDRVEAGMDCEVRVLYDLARYLEAPGRRAAARRAYERLHARDAGHADVAERLARLVDIGAGDQSSVR
jgi:hypothetical protein